MTKLFNWFSKIVWFQLLWEHLKNHDEKLWTREKTLVYPNIYTETKSFFTAGFTSHFTVHCLTKLAYQLINSKLPHSLPQQLARNSIKSNFQILFFEKQIFCNCHDEYGTCCTATWHKSRLHITNFCLPANLHLYNPF